MFGGIGLSKTNYKITPNKNRLAVNIFDFFKPIIFVFALVSIVFTFIIRDANVVGNSMTETLHNGDKVLITSMMYTPASGDIVAINTENLKQKRIIKRVIATEGQMLTINYESGEVSVDGIIIDEPYVSSQMKKAKNTKMSIVIPQGSIFVMGDNRYISLDSRDEKVGLISVDDVIGKAQLVFFPFDRIRYLY